MRAIPRSRTFLAAQMNGCLDDRHAMSRPDHGVQEVTTCLAENDHARERFLDARQPICSQFSGMTGISFASALACVNRGPNARGRSRPRCAELSRYGLTKIAISACDNRARAIEPPIAAAEMAEGCLRPRRFRFCKSPRRAEQPGKHSRRALNQFNVITVTMGPGFPGPATIGNELGAVELKGSDGAPYAGD